MKGGMLKAVEVIRLLGEQLVRYYILLILHYIVVWWLPSGSMALDQAHVLSRRTGSSLLHTRLFGFSRLVSACI